MNGSVEQLKKRYQRIQDRYTVLDKKDDKGRSIYTYSKLVSMLSEEFCYQERTIEAILLIDIEKWYAERRPKTEVVKQAGLFDGDKEQA